MNNGILRELIITLYLFTFGTLFKIFNLLPLKNKITFVDSFEQNNLFILKEIVRKDVPIQITFLYKKINQIPNVPYTKFISYADHNIINKLKAIYHIATSKYVIVDNYYAFLSSIEFKKEVKCVQVWHAAGAIKMFGLKDKTISNRSKRSIKRFIKVYNQFQKVAVGSEEMVKIFIEAFDLSSENMLRTGIPRTDLFFDNTLKVNIASKLKTENQNLNNKKVILYAPTYRDNELNTASLNMDIDLMYRYLKDEYVLLLKFHPAISSAIGSNIIDKYREFVYDYSKYPDINELLLITDILITDYSSIPFEFALLNKPMIFFPYDLKKYQEERGLWTDYDRMVPGPIVFSTQEIIDTILRNSFDLEVVERFSNLWNQYSNGNSSENLVNFLFSHEITRINRKASFG